MAKKFANLKRSLSPEAQARVEARVAASLFEIAHEVALSELRQARGLSQKELAERLHIRQPSIAKLESRTDMYISTLRSHIRAMGGELEIIARFPEGEVRIAQFQALDTQ